MERQDSEAWLEWAASVRNMTEAWIEEKAAWGRLMQADEARAELIWSAVMNKARVMAEVILTTGSPPANGKSL